MRGQNVSYTVTVTNTGTTSISDLQLSFSVGPSTLVKDLSPGTTASLGALAPGSTAERVWTGRADREGSGTITARASSPGTRLAEETMALTVRK